MDQQLYATLAQIPVYIDALLSTQNSQSHEAQTLAELLSEDFADREDRAATVVRGIIRDSREAMNESMRDTFDDLLALALGRIDAKAGIEYFFKDEDGNSIQVNILQEFILDFFRYAHQEVKVPIVFCPTGSGKSSLVVALKCWEIGKNQNIYVQMVSLNDKEAAKRGSAARGILESAHFRKLFPHIVKDDDKWSEHELLVKRTKTDHSEIRMNSRGDATSIEYTWTSYGALSGSTGSRARITDFDDLVSEENAVQKPTDGDRIYQLLTTKWFTRKKSPFTLESLYKRIDNPWRGRIIGTPWAYNDAVYRLRDWDGGCVLLVGVNRDFTAHNVQIWGLPKKYVTKLRAKYGTGRLSELNRRFPRVETLSPVPEEFVERLLARDDQDAKSIINAELDHEMGTGYKVDRLSPPDFTMEIPLERPRIWYLGEYVDAPDIRVNFNRPYRCEVFTESELAYPGFEKSTFTHYPDYREENRLTGVQELVPIIVKKYPLFEERSGGKQQAGWRCEMVDPPEDYYTKIGFVDLSGVNRPGTVLGVATLSKFHRLRLVEISIGAWTGGEISEQADQVFKRHKDLHLLYIETESLQTLFVEEMEKHKEAYSFWSRIGHFETSSKKNDHQIGILTMGTSLAKGGMEIPNTWHRNYAHDGHGKACPCGYCKLISDLSTQTRLTKVTSDLLVMLWGLHVTMPRDTAPQEAMPPSGYKRVKSGYELATIPKMSKEGRFIFGKRSNKKAADDETKSGKYF